jgi:hypothetical protein
LEPDVAEVGEVTPGNQAENEAERDAADQHGRFTACTPASCVTGVSALGLSRRSAGAMWVASRAPRDSGAESGVASAGLVRLVPRVGSPSLRRGSQSSGPRLAR